ncbi:MAG: DUF58 domain-containing protein [Planctomycetaceae bacterium]|nr:DUF58 domain-containing protein [Planctomycetaceae bacterium]
MIPSRAFIAISAVLCVPLLLAGVSQNLADIALVANMILAIVACVDLLISPSPHDIEIERAISDVLSVGTSNPASLVLHNKSNQTLTIAVHDDAGPLCKTERMPQSVTLAPWTHDRISYSILPHQRGASQLASVHLRFLTRLRLWHRHQERPIPKPIQVYPDIRAVYRYELMAQQNRLAEIGVRNVRMPGQGREFERLREFRYGDEVRHIDWKATARQRTLICREFNVERNQNIVIMVDCGRFMRNEADGISYLDRALNSAIMLSYIALGQGDNVALLAFSNRIERFVRPVRGKPGIQSILRSTYDIQASVHASDYSLAVEYLTMVQRKRALVIMITFVTDELQLRVIGESLPVRSLPYLPMCVLLQDVGLRAMADRVPETDLEAYQTAAAAQILTGQSHEAASLREEGVLLIDTPPDLLTERLINEYLAIKSRGIM